MISSSSNDAVLESSSSPSTSPSAAATATTPVALDKPTDGGATTASCDPTSPTDEGHERSGQAQLLALPVAELKTLLARVGITDYRDCLSKADLVRKLRAARYPQELASQSIAELRGHLASVKVTDTSDCLTKEDLVLKLVEARAAAAATATSPTMPPSSKRHATGLGYATDGFRGRYLEREIAAGRLPATAVRDPRVLSLDAPADPSQPIFFWQLFSIMGPGRIKKIVTLFYQKVFADPDAWFRKSFSDLAPIDHHIATQAAMWYDVLGGGRYYHGGEYRLSFHHQHNAMRVMTQEGAQRWSDHMMDTLAEGIDFAPNEAEAARVRVALLDFLRFAMEKYAVEFRFDSKYLLLDTPPRAARR